MLKKSQLSSDDLFEKSSMSFGEHLEELRKALTKAFVWLGLGVAVGLYFGENIVKFVSEPLKESLTDFYILQAKQQFKRANGEEPSPKMAAWMSTNGVVPERVFVDPLDVGNTPAITLDKVADVVAADKANEAVKEQAEELKKLFVNDAENNTTETDAAETSTAEQTEAETVDKVKSLTNQEVQAAANPWKGVDIDKLERLQPVLLWRPIQNKLLTFNAMEGFMIWLKAGFVAGVIIGSPGIFYHIWQFLAAGLYPHERRYVYWYLPLSLLLFFGGVSLAFFVIFRLVLGFLLTYNLGLDIDIAPRLNEYMSFALMLPLGFGVAFQLPIVMLGLHRFGVVSVELYVSKWRMAVLVIAFLAMVLTPADVYSMIGLFFPLVGLYFFGILLCKWMPTGPGIGSQALDPQG